MPRGEMPRGPLLLTCTVHLLWCVLASFAVVSPFFEPSFIAAGAIAGFFLYRGYKDKQCLNIATSLIFLCTGILLAGFKVLFLGATVQLAVGVLVLGGLLLLMRAAYSADTLPVFKQAARG
ncbi:hypothetical protein [Corynebacterium caspium]|uniref:hypothetical protein n=1 Tax=Corynebacterium caspium TaxID=234828 RepID=UPI00037B9D89|nr:hypothetical protein [Corynebacterium caspium]WKD59746.1 hypothetical protein CCASP_06835 [Corynebacterium caspium DSM 44850]